MEYSFSDAVKGIQDHLTEPEIDSIMGSKDKILFDFSEHLYTTIKKLSQNDKIQTFRCGIDYFNDNGDAQAERADLEQRMVKNYLLDLKKRKIINSVSFDFIKIRPPDEFPDEVIVAIIQADIPSLKKFLKKSTHNKSGLKSRPIYDPSRGVLVWFDKSCKFSSSQKRNVFALLWKNRQTISKAGATRTKGTRIDVEEVVYLLYGVNKDATKVQKAKAVQLIREMRKQLRGFPLGLISMGKPVRHFQLLSRDR